MKTAMQELYTSLHNTRQEQWIDLLMCGEKYLIEKEKQQLKEAVNYGLWNNDVVDMENYSDVYYQETFGDPNEAGI